MFRYVAIFPMALASLAFGQSVVAPHAQTPATAPISGMKDSGVKQAIAFERLKDSEDALQARKEQRHPSRFDYQADRQLVNDSTVKDPGSSQYQRDKIGH